MSYVKFTIVQILEKYFSISRLPCMHFQFSMIVTTCILNHGKLLSISSYVECIENKMDKR